MTNELIFRLLTLLLFVVILSISIYFRHRAERQGGQLNQREGQRLLLPLRLLGLAGLLPLIGYLVNPEWVSWARFDLPGWVRWVAALVAFGTIPALYTVFATIGNNISPTEATRVGHQLITTGPYRWIRHPLYTFGAFFFLALSVLTTLWWPALFLGLGLFGLIWRVRFEEANLIARFGDEYRAYMQRTGRFLPKLR
jgi:protein-S-isoprenylcysteine O-methyltransferase Ste14